MPKPKKTTLLKKIRDLKVDLEFESRSGNFVAATAIDKSISKLEKKLLRLDTSE